jgi:hypothetical protein
VTFSPPPIVIGMVPRSGLGLFWAQLGLMISMPRSRLRRRLGDSAGRPDR